jgi:hypothetical protein
MIPYITNRGGPMVGLEALSMQGLPIDKLLLTRETEDQLADLAGNAMSTTVVGACILAALVKSKRLLKAGDGKNAMDVDDQPPMRPIYSDIKNADNLEHRQLDLSVTEAAPFQQLLSDAVRSARLCACEGRTDVTKRELLRCSHCSTTLCRKCEGHPKHSFEPISFSDPRIPPSEFSKRLMSTLPMCISLVGGRQDQLDQLVQAQNLKVARHWPDWSAAVCRASNSILRFVEIKRQEIWSVVYKSADAVLELLLHPKQPEWRFYALPEEHEPANAEIRQLLEHPIGRLSCTNGLLDGLWHFAFPCSVTVPITVEGVGELVPSWEARLGLTEPQYKDSKVFPRVRITVEAPDIQYFDRDITGTYELLDQCGTACFALHKRIEEESGLPSIFFLLDPSRTKESGDSFVFSTSIRRYEYGETRPILAKMAPNWRQSDSSKETVQCELPVCWVRSESARLQVSISCCFTWRLCAELPDKVTNYPGAQYAVPGANFTVTCANDTCANPQAILLSTVPLQDRVGVKWPRGDWTEVDKVHERVAYKELAWVLARVVHTDDAFSSWQPTELPSDYTGCERCAPTAPSIEWVQRNGKTLPIEDPGQAGEYERRLKKRPSPFITQWKLSEQNVGSVRVGINIPTLLHRALSRLPRAYRDTTATLSWRLHTNFVPAVSIDLPPFTLLSNKLDKEHSQPPNFVIPLRKEQLRSLEWMLGQESTDTDPFIEEEVSEAILEALGWRAEGRAQRKVFVRGGVLADQVGYGKTAITLGLIDCTAKTIHKEHSKAAPIPGYISIKGTLVVVPPHLTLQWKSEVVKFTADRYTVIVLSTVSNLNSITIEEIQEADLIIVASNIFKSPIYLDNLALLSGSADFPSKEGRHFNSHLDEVREALHTQVDLLRDGSGGSAAVLEFIKKGRKKGTTDVLSVLSQADLFLSRRGGSICTCSDKAP